jgi:polyhydroxyalkanoate synthase
MSEQGNGSPKNPTEAFQQMAQQFMQSTQGVTQQFMGFLSQAQQNMSNVAPPASEPGTAGSIPNPFAHLAGAFASFVPQAPVMGEAQALPQFDPQAAERVTQIQREFCEQQMKLWQSMLDRSQGKPVDFEVKAEAGDRRFAAQAWQESPVYDYIRQAYLLNSEFVRNLTEILPDEDLKAKEKARFMARQMIDALAPTNFAATNPEFIQRALETQGKSITDGINNLIGDLNKGRISMTDESVFEVGKNIATTEGAVVYENEVMQLIQYTPLTETVAKRPLLIVPPCINKFYIMDLQPANSLVRYAVEQGNTVFLVSWRNAKAEQGHLTWDDYLENGPIAAFREVQAITGEPTVNALGFCIGGTVLTSSLAVLAARGQKPAASLTLLTTLLDFTDTGEIGLFIDEQSIATRDASIGNGGLLTGRELSTTFSALRPNDLVWNYVANNYLKGEKPAAFDLLYWNSDSTNLPGPFACWYMRNMYLNNLLREANRLQMCGSPVDLGTVDMPAYLLATREDHIVPWQSAYLSTGLLGGDKHFVLGASGHIAGVINPASKNKRSYWVNDNTAQDAENWFSTSTEQKGSWWNDWTQWLKAFTDGEVPARAALGDNAHPVIEAAPGRYVKEKAV